VVVGGCPWLEPDRLSSREGREMSAALSYHPMAVHMLGGASMMAGSSACPAMASSPGPPRARPALVQMLPEAV